MRDGAVGLAEPDRRPVGPRRRDHQHGALAVVPRQPLIGAARGVALHVVAPRLAPAGLVEQASRRDRDREALAPEHAARQGRDAARLGPLGIDVEHDVEPASGRQPGPGAVGPFDQRDQPLDILDQADVVELVGRADAVEIGMEHGPARCLVALQQGEGRARRLELRVLGELAQDGAGEQGLAGAEMAGERDDVAGLQDRGEIAGERDGRGLVGEHEPMHARPRRVFAHSAASDSGMPSEGKTAVTRVPRPGAESSST